MKLGVEVEVLEYQQSKDSLVKTPYHHSTLGVVLTILDASLVAQTRSGSSGWFCDTTSNMFPSTIVALSTPPRPQAALLESPGPLHLASFW